MPKPRRRVLWAAAGGALVVVAALVATAGGGPGSGGSAGSAPAAPARSSVTASPVPVVVPGRPGDTPSRVSSDDITAPDGSVYNLLDATFMRMMIPHHAQAVEMAALAPGRASHPQIRAVAERIRAAQGPEIAMMRSWLRVRGLRETDPIAGHDHATMAGMQTPEQLRALAAASGDAFDRMFVEMMSAHHQGAIKMATDVLAVYRSPQVEELATAIATEQGIEINRMREALAAPR
jgi:uncharacterized protein (DUF305 family)